MHSITESTLEQTPLAWFENLGYQIIHSPDIAPTSHKQSGTPTLMLFSKNGCGRWPAGSTKLFAPVVFYNQTSYGRLQYIKTHLETWRKLYAPGSP